MEILDKCMPLEENGKRDWTKLGSWIDVIPGNAVAEGDVPDE